jgi:hypothetical protein
MLYGLDANSDVKWPTKETENSRISGSNLTFRYRRAPVDSISVLPIGQEGEWAQDSL